MILELKKIKSVTVSIASPSLISTLRTAEERPNLDLKAVVPGPGKVSKDVPFNGRFISIYEHSPSEELGKVRDFHNDSVHKINQE